MEYCRNFHPAVFVEAHGTSPFRPVREQVRVVPIRQLTGGYFIGKTALRMNTVTPPWFCLIRGAETGEGQGLL